MAEPSFLDRIEQTPGATALRAESYRLLGLSPGDAVVDVGCGAGHAVAELAAAHLKAIGVDPDPAAIAVARARSTNAMFHVARSDELPLEDESVDGYRAARLFHLLADPLPTLAEARRVLRPGGRIVLVGQDYGFILIDGTDQDLTDVVLLGLESRTPAPRAARSYRDLLLDQGFRDPEVVVHNEVMTDYTQLAKQLQAAAAAAVEKALITQQDADDWLADQTERGRNDRFLAVLPILLVAATR
ncbi:methyltransferase domain-containing protein [Kribbella qitaiheensis]|uniref:Methyltransferase domain-containing protein n=1 Tax=Kribbella qitaiheensis TaxID=1544730 RepID=A0A7G6X0Q2_9ACTN|nr:methyltransferase domain-containing protein [Kribbella qitaiheensis]QNE19817.1 methyltransferase domain-containing protein [Kribbella qitaiheensis]